MGLSEQADVSWMRRKDADGGPEFEEQFVDVSPLKFGTSGSPPP
jgi:hypothetical protein